MTVPAVSPDVAYQLVVESGCSTAKVKVGQNAEDDDEGSGDEARVEAVRDALGPGGRIRVDANGRWEPQDAARHIRRLARYELEYVEQPVATIEAMARLRKVVETPLAADESVRNAADPGLLRALEAADIVVLKVQPLGGVRRALRIAEQIGLPAVVSSALETSVGIAAGLALAAALPDLPYACGLGTIPMLEGDVVADALVPVNGAITVRRPPVDEGALRRYELVGFESDPLRLRLEQAQAAGSEPQDAW